MYENIHFPGWKVVRKIGEGSFGGVYEIHRTLPDGRVEKAALKKLTVPKDSGEIEELLSRSFSTESITAHYKNQMSDLVREYSLTQELSSCGNVVTCHDIQYVQQPDGIGWDVYIRMELLQPLKKALGKEYREDSVIRLGLDLCNALSACQKKNIIHRDIKPENILVSPEGDYKLTDFGIAKVSEKTGSGTLAGTNGYMAPEVANRQHYGPQADIYSLGMVLYWMMNDRTLPFLPLPPAIPSALQRQEAANRRFAGERLPEPVNGSQELKAIVMKACAFSTKKRYQTAQELSNDLRICQQPHHTRKKAATLPPVIADKPDCANEATLDNTCIEDKIVHSDSQNKPVDASRTAGTVIPPKKKKSFKWVVWIPVCILLVCYGMLGIAPTVNVARTLKYQAAQESQQLQMEQDYQAARQLMADGEYLAAEEAFEALDDFEDSADKAQEARHLQEKAQKYQAAQQLLDDGEYLAAAEAFDALGGFENSFTKAREARHLQEVTQNYLAAQQLMDDGEYLAAAEIFSALDGYEDSAEKAQEAKNCYIIRNRQTLAAGFNYTVGLYNDGMIAATGNNGEQYNVHNWKNIVAIAAGDSHIVGLCADGTVVATGTNTNGQCDVGNWTNIVAISAGDRHTVGLCSDGTVVATGAKSNGQCDVGNWTNIVAISAGSLHTVGLRSDGTVITTGERFSGQEAASSWTDIVAVAVGNGHTVGLHSDGTVIAAGWNGYGECDVGEWTDIVAVAAGDCHTVGLRNDGTVVAVGLRDYYRCNVSSWTDIVAIAAGAFHTVGLRSDGTVVATGWNSSGECNVKSWKDIRLPQR